MAATFKNILAPTDFSKPGNNALKTAIELCKKHGAVLHLLYVVEDRYIVTAPAPGAAMSAIINEMDQKARSRLYIEYESIIKTHQIPVQIHMPTGIPFDEICKAAAQMPIDLIVIGTHGASGVREFFMGTTAYNVIKNTIKPVLTIPANFEALHFKNILFPLRPIQGLKDKYEFILTFLTNQDSALHVATLSLQDKEDLSFNNKEECDGVITQLKNSRHSFTEDRYTCNNYAGKVLELSETMNADLIVINATLDYNWIQFFVGPYTQQVVNHSKVPVLSYRHAINISDEVKAEKKKAAERNKTSMSSL